jgi:hypothetical protein
MVADRSPSPAGAAIKVGGRVVVRIPPLNNDKSVKPTDEPGVVTRSDPRGVMVKLDSGRTVLCEPASITVLADDAGG